MTLHKPWIEFRFKSNWVDLIWISIQLSSIEKLDQEWIELNWKEMECKLVEKILKIFLWTWCCEHGVGEIIKKKDTYEKNIFPCLFYFGMG